ncbi:MAG: type II secretion system F family protein, partial [Lautropia sp.]|nr:type II secretion system F family protein [Lautropia sp.]
ALMGLARGGAVAGSRYRRTFIGNVGRRLNDLLLFIDAQRLFQWNLVLGLLVMATIWLLSASWLLMLLGLLLVGMMPNLFLVRLARRRRRQFSDQLPDALMLVAAAIRAGASLPLALRQMSLELPAPCGQEFDLMLREQRLGVSLDAALGSLERRMGGDDLRLFTAAVRIAGDSGGNLAETLERLSDTIRRKLTVEGKIRALTAQGRLQGWIMAFLPVIVAAALFAIEPQAMAPLLSTWQGWVVCGVVAVLEAAGLLFIRRIMDIDI